MNSTWKSLLWKEWREYRWKAAALMAIGVIVPLLLLLVERDRGAIFFATSLTLMWVVPGAALFLGMHAAAAEQSHGTIDFLQSLPIRTSRPAAIKLLMAALPIAALVAVAVALAALVTFLQDGKISQPGAMDDLFRLWGSNNWYAATLAAGVTAGGSILLWMAAAGANQSDEVRAGAVGLLAVLGCWAAVLALPYIAARLNGPMDDWPLWHQLLCAVSPGGTVTVGGGPLPESAGVGTGWWSQYLPLLAATLVVHGVLAASYVLRFGRVAAPRRQASESSPPLPAVAVRTWLAPPRRSALTAIAWKQFRESAPLAAMGGALILFGVVLVLMASRDTAQHWSQFVADVTAAFWLAAGAFVAIVAGIGVLMDDLRPGLHAFWRSRPVHVDRWFVTKYLLGLGISLILVGAAPLALALGLIRPDPDGITLLDDDWRWGLLTGVMMQAMLFSVAVASMALLRQAIYAAVVTIAVCYGGIVVWMAALAAMNLAGDLALPLLIAAMAALTLGGFAVAWTAVRNDWGWKA